MYRRVTIIGYFFWKAKSKKDVGDVSVITGVCYYNTPEGRYAILPTTIQGRLAMIVYPPHFFSRFRERMKLDQTGIELIRRFFKRNASYGFQIDVVQNFNRQVTYIYGSTEEGVGMGVIAKDSIILFRTFVSYDMLKGSQIQDFAKTEKIRKEIQEKNFIDK